ncbi:hypothetical protein [Amycolatopsis sp. WGS_07]|uniref:phage tail protein n=1 Tax=Amycolatopsis sp. WGS_07 TaxID=3076764 RepID=UPI003872D563
MPPLTKARGPRPIASTASPVVRRRPENPSATDPGTADVVRARAQVGNAAVTAAMGGLPRGAEPRQSAWTGQMMLAAQNLVGNQAVANQAAARVPAKPQPVPKPLPAKPVVRKAEAQPAPAPDKKDLAKDKPPEEKPEKGAKKEKSTGARSPGADPKFQALKKDVNAKKKAVGASHPPAAAEAGAAQDAAEAPADDREARGKAAHAEDMDAAQPKEFNKQEFIQAVKKALADKAPKNLDEADKFGESGKAEEVKTEVQGKVGQGKDASAQEIADTTAAPPQPAPDAKQVVPMAADKVPGKPGAPDPAQAAPDQLPASATDMSAGPEQVDRQMADAQVTEQQLAFKNSREPQFDKAVKEKKTMEAHSEAAPKKLRAGEAGELKQVKNSAAVRASATMAGIHATRVATGQQVGTGKKGAKKTDEDKRKEVTDLLQKVFDQTKCDVEKILADLDKKVDDQFTRKEKEARDRFTREHEEGMERYKDERYGGAFGWARWTRDLFAGLPEEANRIYERARDHYLAAMDQIVTEIADTVEAELKRAKNRIAAGRKELKAAVDKLPADLKAIGREAATEFEGKFDELKDTVNDKGTELVDTLATKYADAVKSVDDEIAAEKEKNKGLVAKAADAIGGAIKAIIELGRMLLGILSKAVAAIGAILKDPVGFLGNLVTGVGGGLKLFMKNAGRHLEAGVLAWLLGTGGTIGLQLPKTFDVLGILTMIAMILGLSWPNIRARLARKVPHQALAAAETAVPLVAQVKTRGVAGMWDDLKTRVGDLKKNLISNLVSYLLPTIIIAGITWIVSLFNPASAFIRACKMIIDIIRFIVTNARQIIDFVNAVLDAVLAIARGGTGGVPALVERALARAIPVLIGALAALLGIGGIASKVKEIFQKIARPVNRAIDWVIDKIVGLVKKLWAKIKPKPKRPRRKPCKDSRPARLRRPRAKTRPPKPKGRPDKTKRPDKRKSEQDSRNRDLERAARDLPPRIRAMLAKGIGKLRLRVALLRWKLSYRLRKLAVEFGSGAARVIAANSPEKTLVDQIIDAQGRNLNRMLRDLSNEVMNDPRVQALAAQIMQQRQSGAGTAADPINVPGGFGGAVGARDLREQAITGPGAPGTRRVGPGGMFTAMAVGRGRSFPQEEHLRLAPEGPLVRELAAGSLHPGHVVVAAPVGQPGQGSYRKVAQDPPGDPQKFMRALFAVQAGQAPPPGLSVEQLARVTELARLSQVESARSTSGLVTERLGTHLAGEGALSWQSRYGSREQPMVAGRSGAVGRRTTRDLGLPPTPGLGEGIGRATAADVNNFLRMELDLVRKFVERHVATQGHLFDNDAALRRYVKKELQDHLRTVLFSHHPSGGNKP